MAVQWYPGHMNKARKIICSSMKEVDLVIEAMPVSISLGLWSTLLAYLISIPLGIRKAVKDGSGFDTWTSGLIIVAYAIPGFLFAILLLACCVLQFTIVLGFVNLLLFPLALILLLSFRRGWAVRWQG